MATRKYKKRPDGYYATTVWDGTYGKDGKKHRKALYAKTVRELDAKVRELERQVEEGNFVRSDGDDFLSFSARWLRETKGYREESTRAFYKGIIERHFPPAGDVKMEDFAFVHVRRILDALDGHEATQKKVLMTLKQVVKYAVKQKRYRQNDMEDLFECLPTIRHSPKERRALTPEEKAAVFKVELGPMDRTFLYLLYGCGLRREEVLALNTFSFDFKGNVTISRARAILPGGGAYTKDTKTERGNRTVPIPASIRKTVEGYARECAGDLFPDMERAGFEKMWRRVHRAFKAACPESEGVTPHIFRHNYCTELCYQIPKISVKNVARLLGDTEAMVLNVYSHLDLLREPTEEVLSAAF